MKSSLIILFIISVLTGCLSKKTEITSEYIINGNWDEHANALEIRVV